MSACCCKLLRAAVTAVTSVVTVTAVRAQYCDFKAAGALLEVQRVLTPQATAHALKTALLQLTKSLLSAAEMRQSQLATQLADHKSSHFNNVLQYQLRIKQQLRHA
jgi:cAMP phosphodiesterase